MIFAIEAGFPCCATCCIYEAPMINVITMHFALKQLVSKIRCWESNRRLLKGLREEIQKCKRYWKRLLTNIVSVSCERWSSVYYIRWWRTLRGLKVRRCWYELPCERANEHVQHAWRSTTSRLVAAILETVEVINKSREPVLTICEGRNMAGNSQNDCDFEA